MVEIAHDAGEPENTEQDHQNRSETAEGRDGRTDEAKFQQPVCSRSAAGLAGFICRYRARTQCPLTRPPRRHAFGRTPNARLRSIPVFCDSWWWVLCRGPM